MHSGADFSGINEAKLDMEYIYDRRDPRAYFSTLQKLEYVIPVEAKPLFQNSFPSFVIDENKKKSVFWTWAAPTESTPHC